MKESTYELKWNDTTFKIGQRVQTTSNSDYAGLSGVILEIHTGEDKETDNLTPDIHCSFDFPESEAEIQKLEERFSSLYNMPKKLDELVDELDCVVKRKGKGLMQGIEITKPLAEVNKKTIEEGLLIIQAQGNVIRFVPPLIVEEKHIDEMIEKLKRALV